MDAVYALGSGSMWGNKEIYYSSKLLRKFTNVKDIYTVGIQYGDLKHIPHTDNKEKVVNLWEKCYAACIDKNISDPFLFLNDDHYIIQPTDIENYPNYYCYRISEFPYRTFMIGSTKIDKTNHPYWTIVQSTEDILGDVLFFNVHSPVVIHKKKFIAVFLKHYNDVYDAKLLLKTTYLNGESGVQLDDYKVRKGENYKSIMNKIKGRPVFSSGDLCTPDLERVLKEILES